MTEKDYSENALNAITAFYNDCKFETKEDEINGLSSFMGAVVCFQHIDGKNIATEILRKLADELKSAEND